MTTRRKLTLINGMMDEEGIRAYRGANGLESGPCSVTMPYVPPLPFPDDDLDWLDFDDDDDIV